MLVMRHRRGLTLGLLQAEWGLQGLQDFHLSLNLDPQTLNLDP